MNDQKKTVKICLSTLLLFIPAIIYPLLINGSSELNGGLPIRLMDSPIVITDNIQIFGHSSGGNGDENSPWIIENKVISGGTSDCIIIKNTDEYITIKDCALTDGNTGLYLENTRNIKVINSDMSNNENNGIWVKDSTNIKIQQSTLKHNINGIHFDNTHQSEITGCTISNNYRGVWLGYSTYNTVTGNTFENNEIGIQEDGDGLNNYISDNTGIVESDQLFTLILIGGGVAAVIAVIVVIIKKHGRGDDEPTLI